jgi:hypothetical protein
LIEFDEKKTMELIHMLYRKVQISNVGGNAKRRYVIIIFGKQLLKIELMEQDVHIAMDMLFVDVVLLETYIQNCLKKGETPFKPLLFV